MIKSNILKIVKELELKTRKLISGPLSGDWRTKLKGSGFDFDQLTEYQQGHDIRFIDWKSSARTNQLLIRQYLEDRNRTVFIAIDLSASLNYGSGDQLKVDVIKELGSILMFASLYLKDSVGLLIFTDTLEMAIPARPGAAHVYSLVNRLLTYKPKSKKTNFDSILNYICGIKSKKLLVYLLSDFMDEFDISKFAIAAKKHELIAFRIIDEQEIHFNSAGILEIQDSENFVKYSFNTNSIQFNDCLIKWHKNQETKFKSAKVDFLDVISSKSYISELLNFFRQRMI